MAATKKKASSATKKAAPESLTTFGSDDIAVEVLSGLRASFGGDVAQFVGSDAMSFKIRGIVSTQCPGLDAALGRGGYPLSRLTIIHGKEGSGKTTLLLHAIAEVQRLCGLACLFDKEYTLDPDYARSIGVDINRLIIGQDGALEDIISYMHKIMDIAIAFRERTKRRVPILIGLDSINAALSRARINGQPGDHHIATEARIWSEELPKLLHRCFHEDILLIFISQVRSKINVMFGDADDIAGGNAPKFYASVLMKITPTGSTRETADGSKATAEDKDAIKVGYMVKAEAKKNKVAPPFRTATFLVRYGKGVDFNRSLLDVALDHDIIEKNGAWFSYKEERIGQGAIAAAKFLDDNPDIAAEINAAFRSKMGWDGSIAIIDGVPALPVEDVDPTTIEHSTACIESGLPPDQCTEDCPVAVWYATHSA